MGATVATHISVMLPLDRAIPWDVLGVLLLVACRRDLPFVAISVFGVLLLNLKPTLRQGRPTWLPWLSGCTSVPAPRPILCRLDRAPSRELHPET